MCVLRAAEPSFYSMNSMLLGKTYVRMKRNPEATPWLLKARDWKQEVADDKKAREEALLLLKQIGYKGT